MFNGLMCDEGSLSDGQTHTYSFEGRMFPAPRAFEDRITLQSSSLA